MVQNGEERKSGFSLPSGSREFIHVMIESALVETYQFSAGSVYPLEGYVEGEDWRCGA